MAGPVDAMSEQLGWVAELAADGVVLGAHLEGPFLSSARCGAQNHAHLLAPDPLVLAKLLAAGQDAVRTVTVAPELPGALDLIRGHRRCRCRRRDRAHRRVVRAGDGRRSPPAPRLATHLFNAMGSMSQRAPGRGSGRPRLRRLRRGHQRRRPRPRGADPARRGQRPRPGRPDHRRDQRDRRRATGTTPSATRTSSSVGGEARLAGTKRLAGSTLTMDEAVRRAVREVGLSDRGRLGRRVRRAGPAARHRRPARRHRARAGRRPRPARRQPRRTPRDGRRAPGSDPQDPEESLTVGCVRYEC